MAEAKAPKEKCSQLSICNSEPFEYRGIQTRRNINQSVLRSWELVRSSAALSVSGERVHAMQIRGGWESHSSAAGAMARLDAYEMKDGHDDDMMHGMGFRLPRNATVAYQLFFEGGL